MIYPKREPFFAHRYIRLLTKSAVAMEVGGNGFMLLTIVAMQEDTCRYTRPVLYFNEQLRCLIGLKTEKGLRSLRDQCVSRGWLFYESGGSRKAGRYMVAIPEHAIGIPDGGCDESPEEHDAMWAQSGRNQTVIGPRSDPDRTSIVTSIIPSPLPSPNPKKKSKAQPSQDEGKRPDEAGGTETPTEPTRLTDRELIRPLAGWVRWRTNDADAEADNVAELAGLVREHGAQVIAQAAKAGHDATKGKIWPNQIAAYLPGKPVEFASDALEPEVIEALAVFDRLGYDHLHPLLGFLPNAIPDGSALRKWIETGGPGCAREILKVSKVCA